MAAQQGRSERRGESYSEPYGEPLSDVRTPLAVFFRILLDRSCDDAPDEVEGCGIGNLDLTEITRCGRGDVATSWALWRGIRGALVDVDDTIDFRGEPLVAAFQNMFRFLGSSIDQYLEDGTDFSPSFGG